MRYRVALIVASLLTVLAVPLVVQTAEASTYPLQFGKIYYDSPGSDTGSNTSLNAEYVTVKNTSSTTRSLTGYTVRDKVNHVYKFGTFSLGGGKWVRIHTGKGTDTSTDLYWGRSWYVWNNTGDKAYLRNTDFVLRDTCEWTSVGSGYKWC
jgi:Lamin Tail Domain